MAGTRITVKRNGSLRVEGDFVLVDQDGNEYNLHGRERISLCRCGHSKDKPFCDGSHGLVNFASDDKARDVPLPETPKPPAAAG